MLGHSHCDTCGHELSTADLFPIISYIALKGRCRYCGAKVPPRDLIFEIILGILFAGTLALHGSLDAIVISTLALEVLLLGLSLADWDSGVIPGGFLVAILVVWIMTVSFVPDIRRYALEGVIAAAGSGLIVAIITAIAGRVKKTKVSYGPTSLVMCLMLFLRFSGALTALALGVVLCLIFILICKSGKRKIALAPAISIAAVAALLIRDVMLMFVPGFV